MATAIAIIVIVAIMILLAIFLVSFAYPGFMLKLAKSIFIKPFQAVFKNGQHKPAPIPLKTGTVKTDGTEVK